MNVKQYILYLTLVISVHLQPIGEEVQLHDLTKFPFFAILRIPTPKYPDLISRAVCGGSLIHTEWVLTAAHCFTDNFEWIIRQNVDIIYIGSAYATRIEPIQNRKILKIHPHPNYTNPTVSVRNDIALIKSDAPFVLSNSIQLIALPLTFPQCEHGVAIGTSIINFNYGTSMSFMVKYVKLPIKQRKELKASLDHPTETQIFFEFKLNVYETVDLGYKLQSDSGGPVICVDVDPLLQIGILSLKTSRTDADTVLKVIERVDLFMDFIQQYVPAGVNQDKSVRAKVMSRNMISSVSNGKCNQIDSFVISFVIISFVCSLFDPT